MNKDTNKSIFGDFISRSKWKKGVPAVCKPCWEIKYCPYGPLVEDFPLKEVGDSKSCRIFGHDCPVFFVAEPFTETKELRRVTRGIPQSVQINVILRDGKVCAICGEKLIQKKFNMTISYHIPKEVVRMNQTFEFFANFATKKEVIILKQKNLFYIQENN